MNTRKLYAACQFSCRHKKYRSGAGLYLQELSNLVKKSKAAMGKKEWAELESFLKDMDSLLSGINEEVNKTLLDETMVSKGSYSFEMTDEEMQKECAGAKQVMLMQYLLTA